MNRALPDIELLRRLISYDPKTGHLTWNERRPEDFNCDSRDSVCAMWNKKFAGKRALNHLSARGYLVGSIKPFSLSAHRVAWAIQTGCWPMQVDHQNHDRTDNRFINLRDVSNAENAKNMRKSSRNKSGVVGVFKHSQLDKWTAQIVVDGKARHIGLFDSLSEAAAARKAAEIDAGFHDNHGVGE